ncbi:MAG: DUF1822 family protein [Coleofasciculus sp. S288]|nr:DUF1822 family protein [Coleofasciculus sp. S288]
MNSTAPPCLTVPLISSAHQLARQFAAEQSTPEKGLRVYLNTLAVWAVHRYLQWLAYEPDLSVSDSWNPSLRALFDVADLVLPNLGKLECRPVLPGETVITLPSEVMQDRIGYVAVQFGLSTESVELLGFAPATVNQAEVLPIVDLQPLEAMLEYLDGLELPVQLSRWLQNRFEAGWQPVEDVLALPVAMRLAPVRRAKQIELETDFSRHALVLVLTLQPEDRETLVINLQLCSVDEQIALPSQLKLQVLTESGDIFREITASETDTFLQYEFAGQWGERFSVKVVLGSASFTEAFAI